MLPARHDDDDDDDDDKIQIIYKQSFGSGILIEL